MQAQGLFSGVDPNLIRQQEAQARQANNLSLAQSSNPFASTMFTGLNLADELRSKTADVFGNPIPDSPAVAAAKEEKGLEEEVAKMVMQGRQQGKDNATIAQEVQQFLAGRGKFNKAEQYRTKIQSEQMEMDKGAAEIDLKKAQAGKENANAKKLEAEAVFAATSVTDRVAAIKARFPKIDPTVAQAAALDKESFADMMVGKEVETAEGVFMVRPDGSKERIGSPTDRSTKVTVDAGSKKLMETYAPLLSETQVKLEEMPNKIKGIDAQLEAVKQKPMILGAQAQNRVAVASALATLGFSTPANMEKLNSTKAFISAQKSLVLKELDNKLGTAISDADRNFIESQFGTLEDNPKALEEILTRIKDVYIKDTQKLKLREQRLVEAINSNKVSAMGGETPTPSAPAAPPEAKPPLPPVNDPKYQNPKFKKFFEERKAKNASQS